MTIQPDADLLALCHHLQDMQAEWQRLYDATSDQPGLTTSADHLWDKYSDDIWPGIVVSSTVLHEQPHPEDVVGQLIRLRATTAADRIAKAHAILTLEEAVAYCECRDDCIQIMLSLVRDVAGIETHNLGADAARGAAP